MKTNKRMRYFNGQYTKTLAGFLGLFLIGISTLGLYQHKKNEGVSADIPTFEICYESNCAELSKKVGETFDLSIMMDGKNEGQGLLGTQAVISYPESLIEIKNINPNTNIFDGKVVSYIENRAIWIVGATGRVSEGGTPLQSRVKLATITVTLKNIGQDSLNFRANTNMDNPNGTVVINYEKQYENRTGNGFSINVTGGRIQDCGNGKKDAGEDCDGSDFGGETCQSIRADFISGTLKCTNECTYNTSSCVQGYCGDKKVTTTLGEYCENGVAFTETCQDFGYTGGTLTCDPDTCEWDFKNCGGDTTCGNGTIEAPENCDDGNNITESCPYGSQEPCTICNMFCREEEGVSTYCGDGIIQQEYEECEIGNEGCDSTCHFNSLDYIDVATGSGSDFIAPAEPVYLNTFAYTTNGGKENITSSSNYSVISSDITSYTLTQGAATFQTTGNETGSVTIEASYQGKTDRITFQITSGGGGDDPVCGNNVVENGEECDGGNNCSEDCHLIAGQCNKIDSSSCSACGSNECYANGSMYTFTDSSCSIICASSLCGNGIIDEGEACDGTELANETCQTQGFNSGTLSCSETCELDLTACVNNGGHNSAEEIEEIVEKVIETEPVIEQISFQPPAPVKEVVLTCENDFNQDGIKDEVGAGNKDHDKDGLSSITECILGSNWQVPDTDGDGCSDGKEINLFGTNPTDRKDFNEKCLPKKERFLITDPKAGWTLAHLDNIEGFAPKNTNHVSVYAYPVEKKLIQAFNQALDSGKIETIKTVIDSLEVFMEENEMYGYEEVRIAIEDTEEKIANFDQYQKENEGENIFEEEKLIEQPIILIDGSLTFNPTEEEDLFFTIGEGVQEMYSGVYDLVAVASLDNNQTKTSAPIRIYLDKNARTKKPAPRSIGEKNIEETEEVSLGNIFIGDVLAANGATIEYEIGQEQPIVSGDSEYGSQVYAVWHSLVLASSVIADSEEGSFAIQSPQELEKDVSHKVTLYAVKTNDEGGKIRSESVNVYFRIKSQQIQMLVLYILIALLVLGTIGYSVRKNMMKKKSHKLSTKEKEEKVGEVEKVYTEKK